jgi:peptidoglycan/xylan/chitin deacetylase (PgdA/CDA1 family)
MYHAPYEVGLAMSGIPPATPEEQRGYIEEQTEILERVTGQRPVGFRSPIGDWVGEAVPNALIEYGYTYDSSLQGHDFNPYRLRLGDTYSMEEPFEVTFGEKSALLEIPLHWDTNDFAQFEFMGYYMNPDNPWFSPSPFGTTNQVLENFTGSFDACYEHVPGGVWNTILHPQCCGRDMKLNFLDGLFRHVTEKDDLWLTTMSQAADAYDDSADDPTPGLVAPSKA